MRILFLGSNGLFSRTVLISLLEARCNIAAVWLAGVAPQQSLRPDRFSHLPIIRVTNPDTLTGIAEQSGIPVQGIVNREQLHSPSLQRAISADLALVACFPFLLPQNLLALPSLGCLNLHPSLLPAYRGPAPLFWQFWAGEREGGITLHVMTEHVDAGDIVAQESVPLPAGIGGAAVNRQLAVIGGRLACAAVDGLWHGKLARRSQCETRASYFSWPQERDFSLAIGWSAERAFRFVRGTADWGQPYQVISGAHTFWIEQAVGFLPDATLPTPWARRGDELWLRFTPGVLRVIPSS